MSFSQTITYDTASELSFAGTVHVSAGAVSLVLSGTYPTTNPVVLSQARVMATSFTQIANSASVSGLDAVKYQLQVGNSIYWWNATNWVVSDGTYATANTVSEINTNAPTLFSGLGLTGAQFIQVRAFLHSASGSTTPTLTSVTLSFGLAYGTATSLPQCLVYCYLKDLLGAIPYSATQPAVLYVKNQRTFFYGNTAIAPFTKSVNFDATGYAALNVIETTTAGEKLEFFISYYDKNSLRSVKLNNAMVPNLSTCALNSFTDVSPLDFG